VTLTIDTKVEPLGSKAAANQAAETNSTQAGVTRTRRGASKKTTTENTAEATA
jgi:large subunit ribosomal protein L22